MRQADGHPAMLKDPPPRALLDDFASDAIHFTLRFWIDCEGTGRCA